ncbi:MAG: hypothetical protein FJ403_16815 [Verrucomicrobia bacterium]|nr:hypothetical protein [Verrucomicrobiota bacterium]
MSNRTHMNIIPDQRFADLRTTLSERLARVAASVNADNFRGLLDGLMQETLRRGFAEANAHEGTVWLLDREEEHVVPAFNTGPEADKIVGQFKQPLTSGLICMVFASEQPFVENFVYKNSRQSKLLDSKLGVQTFALIAATFYFLNACRGVISCVQLRTAAAISDPPGFTPEHLVSVQRTTAVFSRLFEFSLLSQTIGWSGHR